MRRMNKVFTRVHFDKDKQPKNLAVSYNSPELDDYNNIREGAVIISIISKENSTGFSLTTGDVADLIDVLSIVRKSLINKVVKLQQQQRETEE